MQVLEHFQLSLVYVFEVLGFVKAHDHFLGHAGDALVVLLWLLDVGLLDLPLLLFLLSLLLLCLAILELGALAISLWVTALQLARADKALLVLLWLFSLFVAGFIKDHLVVLHDLLRDELKDQVHLVVVLGDGDWHSVLVDHLLAILHGLLGVVSQVLMVRFSYFHDFVGVKPKCLLRRLLLLDFSVLFEMLKEPLLSHSH